MYISGKVTHSVLTFLAKESVDIEPLFENTDLPAEFLRDPSCWLEAPKVEQFLQFLEGRFSPNYPGESLIEKVGLANHELRTWGVLDSVLKMMMDPQDIYMQPQRFISYFVSPAPPAINIINKSSSIEFEVPITTEEYPLFAAYMKSIFEVLPCFMGKAIAAASWVGNKISVDWNSKQEDLFPKDDEEPNYNPEVVQSLVSNVESKERDLENQIEINRLKDLEIEKLQKRVAQFKLLDPEEIKKTKASTQQSFEELEKVMNMPLINIQSQMLKMSDYLTRAQQLITLLVGQNRMDKQVKEAMKRVDWDHIRQRFTHTVQDGVNNIESIRREVEAFKNRAEESELETDMTMSKLDTVIDRAVSALSVKLKNRHIFIDRMLFFGRDIFINKSKLEKFFEKLLEFSASEISDKGYIRVMSRPRPRVAEVEIVDNGQGMNKSSLENFMKDPFISSVISEHKATLQLITSGPEGSTLLIQIPSIGVNYVKDNESSRTRDLR